MSKKVQKANINPGGWQPDRPYNAIPLLPPAAEVETRAVLRQCITARAALAELKQAAALIPNQAMLINTLPLLEARASSEIENIVTTTDELFQHAGRRSAGRPGDQGGLALQPRAARRFRGAQANAR